MADAVSIQRDYYRRTASHYDSAHTDSVSEHDFSLAFMLSMINFLDIDSVLDIGSGTGRAILQTKAAYPEMKITAIEPSLELRMIGHAKGLSEDELIDGDAQRLAFADGEFDLVCEFGALHHIPDPHQAIDEMLRVARKAIFISDCNNFGQGGLASRTTKQVLRSLHLWKAADFVKTRGKGYTISEGDGLAYSYSVFSDYSKISRHCKSVHLLNTKPSGMNLYRSSMHIALLGIK
ncbi:MAG: methyltransferase type 11 [Acidobacteriales bacterium 59-55]|nr:class I SAM-dependent methyltransferase [Terriglobales bacterium]OJV44006.1 MAG: methyltransferase type 11 [Acidobacteriales bacterium 59-55]